MIDAEAELSPRRRFHRHGGTKRLLQGEPMTGKKAWVFFYGSFINRQVLARGGFTLERFEIARLWGFDIVIETLATLVRSDRHCVYGIACEFTHEQLRGLYAQDWLGGVYLPEAVVVETEGARLLPACVSSPRPALPPVRPTTTLIGLQRQPENMDSRTGTSRGWSVSGGDTGRSFRRCLYPGSRGGEPVAAADGGRSHGVTQFVASAQGHRG